jgi:hypothetical protein
MGHDLRRKAQKKFWGPKKTTEISFFKISIRFREILTHSPYLVTLSRTMLGPAHLPRCCEDVALVPGIAGVFRGETAGVAAGVVPAAARAVQGGAPLAGCAQTCTCGTLASGVSATDCRLLWNASVGGALRGPLRGLLSDWLVGATDGSGSAAAKTTLVVDSQTRVVEVTADSVIIFVIG